MKGSEESILRHKIFNSQHTVSAPKYNKIQCIGLSIIVMRDHQAQAHVGRLMVAPYLLVVIFGRTRLSKLFI